MVFEVTISNIACFLTGIFILGIFSVLDLRQRRIENAFVIAAGIIGFMVIVVSGHLVEYLYVHVTAVFIVVPLVIFLFKMESIGGADAKSLVVITITSPGIEFSSWEMVILEGVLGVLFPIFVMLLGGYIYSTIAQSQRERDSKITPLIPFLMLGYILLQLLAFL